MHKLVSLVFGLNQLSVIFLEDTIEQENIEEFVKAESIQEAVSQALYFSANYDGVTVILNGLSIVGDAGFDYLTNHVEVHDFVRVMIGSMIK